MSSTGDNPVEWYPVTTENRPFVRWWWLGSAVDREGITYNLEEFAGKGLGGVEITPIYGVKGNEANDIEYLSPKWMEMLSHTIAEGKRLGLRVDMNNGTGWPFGGPQITAEYSARKRITEVFTAHPGERFSAMMVASDSAQRPVATLQKVIAVNGEERVDITGYVNGERILTWNVPVREKDWKIYAIFSGRTFQKVKRAAPGGEGFVMNHYDSISVKHYLNRFNEAFGTSGCPFPASFFNDSYEVHKADWTDNYLEEFARDHGYRLELYMPEFIDETNHNEFRGRLLRDYRATLGRLLRENFTDIWLKWVHEKGALVRNQSHGSPANIIDLYAAVEIPECESFGRSDFDIPGLDKTAPSRPSDADPAVLKFASSAAHITGKRLTSAESLTWLTEHFRTSLAACKPELDQMLCSGVNHVFFHGAPYSPAGAKFPGRMFYASVNMSPTNSIWNDAEELFSYLSRCQAFLTAGTPDNDFLLYFPIEDIRSRQGGDPYLMFAIHKMDLTMPDIKKTVNDIINAGYDVDYLSDTLLGKMEIHSDSLVGLPVDGAGRYKAIIVPAVHLMSHESLNKIMELAEDGATVVFTGSLPSDVPGLGDIEGRREKFASIATSLPELTSEATVTQVGKGKIITSPDLESALSLTSGWRERMRTENGLSMIRRKNEAGGWNYFVSLLCNRPIDGYVTLATPAQSVVIFDPLTGMSGLAESSTEPSGETRVKLQLRPGQSVMLKTFPDSVLCESWRYIEKTGEPINLDKGWSISFPVSDPVIEEVFHTDTLTQWCKLPHPAATVNTGMGRYTTTFTVDSIAILTADDWVLDLGDVRESASVKINGEYAGKAWAIPFTLRVGHLLKPGINTIEIDVTNLQANRIADYERRGVEWRIFKDANIASVTGAKTFSFGDWPVIPSGLNSDVKLYPIRFFKNRASGSSR